MSRLAFGFLLLTLLLGLKPVTTSAQLPLSLELRLQGGSTRLEIEGFVDGVAGARETSTGATAGVGVGLRFPGGLVVGVSYQRVFGSVSTGNTVLPTLTWGFDANEVAVFLEAHRSLVPHSPLEPSLGAGVAVGRLSLDDELRLGAGVPGLKLKGTTTTVRLYGLGALRLAGRLGVQISGGYSFGTIGADDLKHGIVLTDQSNRVLTFAASVEGFFAGASLSIGL